jgi:hypothetical protein
MHRGKMQLSDHINSARAGSTTKLTVDSMNASARPWSDMHDHDIAVEIPTIR